MERLKLLVAGNWKMNGFKADLEQIDAVRAGLATPESVDVTLFPPATLLLSAAERTAGSQLKIGAQDCSPAKGGAFTGDLSAPMLKDAGAAAIILGHSERRSLHGETSELVRRKAEIAIETGLTAIICVGETAGERAAGLAESVCLRQLSASVPSVSSAANTVIAYEPVWAIGTGLTPTIADIATIHKPLRAMLNAMLPVVDNKGWRILYGGSVTAQNAVAIFDCDEVNGVLVGGASLNAASFLAIIAAAEKAANQTRFLTRKDCSIL